MNKLLAFLISTTFAACAFAADPATPAAGKTTQQQKMGICNKDATGKKGDERKAFMKKCLSSDKKAPSAAQQAQREKMKSCNTDAKSMKSEERKKFMKTCLSK